MQLSYITEKIGGGDVASIAKNASNKLNQPKLKGSYIYVAKYGASLSYFSTTGSSDGTLYPSHQDDDTGSEAMIPIPITGNAANNLRTRGSAPTSLQLALARGHRWLVMLKSGEVNTLRTLAAREGIDNSYVSRMVNPTTLAPNIVATILDDALPNHLTLFDLAVDPPALWEEQRTRLG